MKVLKSSKKPFENQKNLSPDGDRSRPTQTLDARYFEFFFAMWKNCLKNCEKGLTNQKKIEEFD